MKVVFFLLFSISLFSQDVLNHIEQLHQFNDNFTIEEVVLKDKNGWFNIPFKNETYKYFKNKSTSWIRLNIPKLASSHHFSIDNSMLEELSIYHVKEGNVNLMSLDKNYRFPQVHISSNNTPCKLFVSTKDALSFRTEFKMHFLNDRELAKKVQVDYYIIGAYVFGILVLLISTAMMFIYKRKLAIVWYMFHLTLLIIEYLISTGTFSQWYLDNTIIMKFGIDHITMMFSTMCLSEFFRNFYNYNAKTNWIKKTYLMISILCFIVGLLPILDGFIGNTINVELYAQSVLNYVSLISLVLQFILLLYRVIPFYLFISFLLPIIGIFLNTGDFKEQFTNTYITYFLFQSVYIGILLEVIIIVFHIVKQAIDGELSAAILSQENNKLRTNFQEELLLQQEQHQNYLLSDVHDSFGGYIEALRLNLNRKNLDNAKIDEILQSFKKDYRFLLNSLYVPNVNSENFEKAIKEYCEKMNAVTPIKISFESEKEAFVTLAQNIAKLIFKSASELTTNAIKYADSNKINVKVLLKVNSIILEVKDNGKGFDIENITNNSYGIKNIKNRVAELGGVFNLDSTNNGTCIRIFIPLKVKS